MHSRVKFILLALVGLTILTAGPVQSMTAGSRITLPSGKKIFVSGMNLAWINYAQDVIGFDSTTMNLAIKSVHDSGGNCMRIWLSTNGANDPVFGTNGLVSGPNSKTIATIQKMLKIAKNNNMLLCLCLLTHNFMQNGQGNLTNNRALLTTDAGITAYLTNYVTPVVKAIGVDPNLLCWEVFNEPEGMVENIGWTDNRIKQADVQKMVNRVAGAIHKAVPGVLVSNGAVIMGYTSTVGGSNWYSDATLKSVGGDADGYLDFYMAHYYGWNGVSYSPFTKSYAYWSMDKPLVIGEFPAGSWSPQISSKNQDAASIDTLFDHLYNTGYAGAMSWCYYGDKTDTWLGSFSTTAPSLGKLYKKDSSSISLSGNSDGKFQVSVSAGDGGLVTASLTGRVASGAVDTLKAVPATGYTFNGWGGDTTATGPILVIKVTKDRSIVANFTPNAGTNLIKNGDFSGGATSWSFYAATGNTASTNFSGGSAVVTVSSADTFEYHIQLTQSPIALTKGVTLTLSFSASSTAARTIPVGLSTNGTWHWQGGGTAALTSTKTTFSIEITPDSTTDAGVLQFNLGKLSTTYTIDDVTLVKKSGSAVLPSTASALVGARTCARRSGSAIEWSRNLPLKGEATLRLVSIGGRELGNVNLKPGALRCRIAAPRGSGGVLFLMLESGDVREATPVTLTR